MTFTASNFIRTIIEKDLQSLPERNWGGSPGDAAHHAQGAPDSAKIRTRFPPEPNGYLHIGHAKSIFLNFGLAHDYGGACHLRFDDTNPEKESAEYVQSILDAVRWLGFDWHHAGDTNLYFASAYFEAMYRAAEILIERGLAYVDSQSAEAIRDGRGTLTEAGQNSPYRERMVADNMRLFREMRAGMHTDGSLVLRAKIDMASPNINLRDPVLYRIRRAHHHNTGNTWCIYPMYTFAHPIEDALERITHSLCTLEFEDQRPFYDWLLEKLHEAGMFDHPLPHQYEFARLNLSYVVLSKRKLIDLVSGGYVDGWDDPRLPTLAGARRRGYTPSGLAVFTQRIGVAKADSWIDYRVLEDAMREVLNIEAPRRVAVLKPLQLVIDNYPEGQTEECFAPNHPQQADWGQRVLLFSRTLWIEHDDFMVTPIAGFFRLTPGGMVRLRYGYVVRCSGFEADADGQVTRVHCEYLPETKSGSAGANSVKVKGNIHWLSCAHAHTAQLRLYDRLFRVPQPGGVNGNYLDDLNPDSMQELKVQIEASLLDAKPEERFQFERHGYFVADRYDSQAGAPLFNRIVTLRDTWQR